MTAGGLPSFPAPPTRHPSQTAQTYYQHATGSRVSTEIVVVEALRAEYPQLHLTTVPVYDCNIIAFALAGNAGIAPIDKERDRLISKGYVPPASRLGGSRGALGENVQFGKYLVDWKNKEFVVYVVDGRDGVTNYPVKNLYVLSASIDATNALLLEAGAWSNELHDEVWVFDGGRWQKSRELWESVQKARWEDVILNADMKKAIIGDVNTFFDGRETYERLRVPWKRGVIYYGPPGNGKTISVKAMMHTLYGLKNPIPTLYVRTLASFAGPEYSLNQIFSLARRTAPCLLVFEDLDSIVDDRVRSYFLNEVDGIRKNDGIFMIGSTNHLERLDPGISKRPSRFDRKYLFPNPNEEERTAYMKYWQHKLASNKDLEFPDKLCPAVARITDKFSFAFLQEAMVSSLLNIARDDDDDSNNGDDDDRTYPEIRASKNLADLARGGKQAPSDGDVQQYLAALHAYTAAAARLADKDDPELEKLVLWRQIKKQVKILREDIDAGDQA